jgi:hypothetical protein
MQTHHSKSTISQLPYLKKKEIACFEKLGVFEEDLS